MLSFFDSKIEFLKGVGPQKARALNEELHIFTFGDLLEHYPFRHEDRTRFYRISDVHDGLPAVQVLGRVLYTETLGEGAKRRFTAFFSDGTGTLELIWFQGVNWVSKSIQSGKDYLVYGKPAYFGGRYSISHPEIEPAETANLKGGALMPVYSSTEKLKKKFLDSRGLAKLTQTLLELGGEQIPESLPAHILAQYGLMSKREAVRNAHFPQNETQLQQAIARLKFEELFYIQLKQMQLKHGRVVAYPGQVFVQVPTLNKFYKELLPFDLTDAQKRVIREIYNDMKSGRQMNRLLQGDVGSGKTIVAFICMLMAIDNGAQACLMAPTEILADQHYQGLKEFADLLGLRMAKLTGSSKTAARREIDENLRNGEIKIIVGTHALLEDSVVFNNLGLCVIDEQHRFGVAQRAKLWNKTSLAYPHVLVMTATPIPRTLAMTLYGDLDVSIIDQLPKGRKPIETMHKYDSNRLWIWGFVRKQMELGRQIYIVYPLVEESEKLDYKNLMEGKEAVDRAFGIENVSMVHGRMKPEAKDWEMKRFTKHETKIMVATTVIEVGVNVPNASVMIIEDAERFGLAQLHQLRGRVGRGAEQSYCILVTGNKLSKDSKVRIQTMVQTNNGFEIADVDLKLRGPGDMAGTQQSGVIDLKFADLAQDGALIQEVRRLAQGIIEEDPQLAQAQNSVLAQRLAIFQKNEGNWSRIS